MDDHKGKSHSELFQLGTIMATRHTSTGQATLGIPDYSNVVIHHGTIYNRITTL